MQNKKLSIGEGGGGVWIFSGTAHSKWEIMVMQNSTLIGLNETSA